MKSEKHNAILYHKSASDGGALAGMCERGEEL